MEIEGFSVKTMLNLSRLMIILIITQSIINVLERYELMTLSIRHLPNTFLRTLMPCSLTKSFINFEKMSYFCFTRTL